MDNIINVKLSTKTELKEFMECVVKLSGRARAVQGDTNVDARSTLGIASIMESGPFEVRFIECNPDEINNFNKWKV